MKGFAVDGNTTIRRLATRGEAPHKGITWNVGSQVMQPLRGVSDWLMRPCSEAPPCLQRPRPSGLLLAGCLTRRWVRVRGILAIPTLVTQRVLIENLLVRVRGALEYTAASW